MTILEKFNARFGQIALLIDPEKTNTSLQLESLLKKASLAKVDYIFVGGSTVTRLEFEKTISLIKQFSKIPLVIFPGSSNQISPEADALLFLNLISGRNPDFLIGHHVACAEEVLEMNIEVIPTSYILIDGGKMTSVAYISQTTPIPAENTSIAINTAIAGKLMGHKVTYFDAGSGAINSVPLKTILGVKEKISCPIIVGGGIKTIEEIKKYEDVGANVIVIGNKIENDVDFLLDIQEHISNSQNTSIKNS